MRTRTGSPEVVNYILLILILPFHNVDRLLCHLQLTNQNLAGSAVGQSNQSEQNVVSDHQDHPLRFMRRTEWDWVTYAAQEDGNCRELCTHASILKEAEESNRRGEGCASGPKCVYLSGLDLIEPVADLQHFCVTLLESEKNIHLDCLITCYLLNIVSKEEEEIVYRI